MRGGIILFCDVVVAVSTRSGGRAPIGGLKPRDGRAKEAEAEVKESACVLDVVVVVRSPFPSPSPEGYVPKIEAFLVRIAQVR